MMDFAHYKINTLNCWAPIPLSHTDVASLEKDTSEQEKLLAIIQLFHSQHKHTSTYLMRGTKLQLIFNDLVKFIRIWKASRL